MAIPLLSPIPQSFPVARSCFSVMQRESREHVGETVGLLVGTCVRPALLYALPPGPSAECMTLSCSSDPEFDQLLLDVLKLRHESRVHVLGYWHKHPAGICRPSRGDLRQAVRMVKHEGWNLDVGPLLAMIVSSDPYDKHRKLDVAGFQLRKDLQGFEPLDLQCVRDNDPTICACLKAEATEQLPRISSTANYEPSSPRVKFESLCLSAMGYKTKVLHSRKNRHAAIYATRRRDRFAYFLPVGKSTQSEMLLDLSEHGRALGDLYVPCSPGESVAGAIERLRREKKTHRMPTDRRS